MLVCSSTLFSLIFHDFPFHGITVALLRQAPVPSVTRKKATNAKDHKTNHIPS